MKLTRLGWAELVGLAAALVLFASMFMPWFLTQRGNRNSRISGLRSQRETIDAWVTFSYFDVFLVVVCLAPVILALIVVTGTELSWDRGELTAIVGITAVMLILFNGFLGGSPDDAIEVTLGPGWWIALGASVAIFVGGAMRMLEGGVSNKPPGF